MSEKTFGKSEYVKIFVFALGILIAGIFLFLSAISFFLVLLVGKIEFLAVTAFFFAVSMACFLLVRRWENLWERFNKRRGYAAPSPRESLVTFGKSLAFLLVFFLVLYIITPYLLSFFPEFIEKDLVLEMLKLLVQINGILIGFTELWFAYVFKTSFQIQEISSEELSKKRSSIFMSMCVVMFLLVASIFSCLSGIAWTNTYATNVPRDNFFAPFQWLLLGIYYFMYSALSLQVPTRVRSQETKTSVQT